MKRLITTALLATIATTASMSAQSLIGGWDFGKFQFDGSSDQTGTFTPTNSYTSDLGSGELFWDGSFSTIAMTPDTDIYGSNDSANSLNLTTPGFGGDLPDNNMGLKILPAGVNENFVFEISTSGLLDIVLSFGAQTQNGSSDIQFAYSVNGGSSYTDLGSAVTIDPLAATTVDFSAVSAVENVSQLLVRGTVLNLAGAENLTIDNVQFVGTVVPEPSAFASIAGALAIGFVAMRRRRS